MAQVSDQPCTHPWVGKLVWARFKLVPTPGRVIIVQRITNTGDGLVGRSLRIHIVFDDDLEAQHDSAVVFPDRDYEFTVLP